MDLEEAFFRMMVSMMLGTGVSALDRIFSGENSSVKKKQWINGLKFRQKLAAAAILQISIVFFLVFIGMSLYREIFYLLPQIIFVIAGFYTGEALVILYDWSSKPARQQKTAEAVEPASTVDEGNAPQKNDAAGETVANRPGKTGADGRIDNDDALKREKRARELDERFKGY